MALQFYITPAPRVKGTVRLNSLIRKAKLGPSHEICAIPIGYTIRKPPIYDLAILFCEDYTLNYDSKGCNRRPLADGKSDHRRG